MSVVEKIEDNEKDKKFEIDTTTLGVKAAITTLLYPNQLAQSLMQVGCL